MTYKLDLQLTPDEASFLYGCFFGMSFTSQDPTAKDVSKKIVQALTPAMKNIYPDQEYLQLHDSMLDLLKDQQEILQTAEAQQLLKKLLPDDFMQKYFS